MRIIDNAIPKSILLSVWANWPKKDWRGWYHYNSLESEKYTTRDAELIPKSVEIALIKLAEVVDNYIVDFAFPDWDLHGSGMHMLCPGGRLANHLDSDIMERTGWKREYSAVLCCNPEWDHNWGGEFIMDDGVRQSALPKLNRLILFRTTDNSWHEVTKVTGPYPRCTISLFYWSLKKTEGKRKQAEFK